MYGRTFLSSTSFRSSNRDGNIIQVKGHKAFVLAAFAFLMIIFICFCIKYFNDETETTFDIQTIKEIKSGGDYGNISDYLVITEENGRKDYVKCIECKSKGYICPPNNCEIKLILDNHKASIKSPNLSKVIAIPRSNIRSIRKQDINNKKKVNVSEKQFMYLLESIFR